MKKAISTLLFFISILNAQIVLAEIPTMKLTWSLSDTSNMSQMKLYYSYHSNMDAKIWQQKCTSPIEDQPGSFSMICTNVPINSYPAYITIVAEFTDNTKIMSNIQEIPSDPQGIKNPAPTIVDIQTETYE